MKNKLYFLLLPVTLACLLAGCGKSATPNTTNDQQIKNLLAGYQAGQDWSDTSLDKIESAFAENKITLEQTVLLEIKAMFSPAALPQEYQGAADTAPDNAWLFAVIHENWGTFSSSTQDALLPFVIPPSDPRSYYYPDLKADEQKNILDKLFNVQAAHADGGPYTILPAQDQITVSYETSRASDKSKAELAVQAIKDSTAKFQQMLGVSARRIDVFINTPATLNGYGESYLSQFDPNMCVMRIRNNLEEKTTKATAVHELFHCFQYRLGLKYVQPDMKWLMEATATWSEDYIYHNYNTEHAYDDDLFWYTNEDFLSLKAEREYGSYAWFYFLYQKSAFAPGSVALILKNSATKPPRQVLSSLPEWQEVYKEFVFWNYNQEPYKKYTDAPSWPANSYATGHSVKPVYLVYEGDYKDDVKLDKGGAQYYFYTFGDNLKSLTFELKDYGASNGGAKSLQAIYKVGNDWYSEDWTELEKRDFCRELQGENVSAVIVMAGNSDLNAKNGGPLKVTAEKKCKPGWRGNIDISWRWDKQVTMPFFGRMVGGRASNDAHMHLQENLIYDKTKDQLQVVTENYNVSEKSEQFIDGNTDCNLMWTYSRSETSGNGSSDYSCAAENVERGRIFGSNDKPSGKLEGQYSISFDLKPPPSGRDNDYKLKVTKLSRRMSRNCSYILALPGPDGLEQGSETEWTNSFYSAPSVDVTVAPGQKRITGEKQIEVADGVMAKLKWDFEKAE